MKEIRQLLGISIIVNTDLERSCVIVASHESTLSLYDFQKLCSVLSAYRFFEIISLRAQCISRVPYSSAIASMYLPGPSSVKENLDVSGMSVPYLLSDHFLGIFSSDRMAGPSSNVSKNSQNHNEWCLGLSCIS